MISVLISQCHHDHGEHLGRHRDHQHGANDPGPRGDDANALIVAYRVTGLLACMTASAAGAASTRGISPCQESTVGLITYLYLNFKYDTNG